MSSRGAEPHDREPARQPTLAAYAPEPVLPPAASAPDWRSRQGRWVDRSLSGRHHLPCCRGLFRPVAKSNPCTIPRSKRQRPSYRSWPHTPNLWTVPLVAHYVQQRSGQIGFARCYFEQPTRVGRAGVGTDRFLALRFLQQKASRLECVRALILSVPRRAVGEHEAQLP